MLWRLLQDCTVLMHGPMQALYLHQLRGCHIQAGPVAGAAFGEDIQDSKLLLATHQLRLHHVVSTDVYVRPGSDPIIEHCSNVGFAPLQDLPYAAFADALKASELPTHSQDCAWQNVQDFQHPGCQQSSNWHVIASADRIRPSAQ
jgi:tubulin-specific chaperone C